MLYPVSTVFGFYCTMSLTEAEVWRDAGRIAVRAGAGRLAADALVARRHARVVRLHSVEGVLNKES